VPGLRCLKSVLGEIFQFYYSSFFYRLKGFHKFNQQLTLIHIQIDEVLSDLFGFTAMPENRLFDRSGSAIVEQVIAAIDGFSQTDTPEWWCSPLATAGLVIGPVIGQARAHVVQQQVGVRPYFLSSEVGHSGGFTCGVIRMVALLAAGLEKQLPTRQYRFAVPIAAFGNANVTQEIGHQIQ
jgi:hypothetical protein